MKKMNQMNQMKHSAGGWTVFEKLAKFFYFYQCKTRFHVHFASSGSLITLYEHLERVLGVLLTYFMNQMNIDEEGLYKANFENDLFFEGDLMNIENHQTSSMFIFSGEVA